MFDRFKSNSAGRFAATIVAAVVIFAQSAELLACSVCQGNPDSRLVQGAEAGVLLMVCVTYGLLLGMIGLGATWFVRQRRNLARIGVNPAGDEAPTGGDTTIEGPSNPGARRAND